MKYEYVYDVNDPTNRVEEVEVEADSLEEAISKLENITRCDIIEGNVRQLTVKCWDCEKEVDIKNTVAVFKKDEKQIVYICEYCQDRYI
jgi:DNA-directed RNA polymerase subunit RPC12/RpoP